MEELRIFEKKNIILFSYVIAFVFLNVALYYLTCCGGFVSGLAEILFLLLYPLGAFLYGNTTGDGVRSFIAGTLSYASFILMIMLTTDISKDFIELGYLSSFIGYHLILLVVIGLIGFFASRRKRNSYLISCILAGVWILTLISGIS